MNMRMKWLALIIVFAFNICNGQQLIIFSKGKEVETTITRVDANVLYTAQGMFRYAEIDSCLLYKDNNSTKVIREKGIHLTTPARAYPYPVNEKNEVGVTQVNTAEGLDAETLYNNSKIFFVETFKSSNDVIQHQDKDTKTVIGKGFSKIYYTIPTPLAATPVDQKLWYTIKIQSKDGKYRYEIYDIKLEDVPVYNTALDESAPKYMVVAQIKLRKEIVTKINDMKSQLEMYMNKPKSDW